MAVFGFNNQSLDRHRVTQLECMQVLSDPYKQEVIMGESRDGNPTSIWIGATMAGRLLEIGVEYLADMDWIYHANSARSHYKKLYERA